MNDRSNDSTEPPPRRREIAAWALFDFANFVNNFVAMIIVGVLNSCCFLLGPLFLFVPCILADHPGVGFMDAIKASLAFGKANFVPSLIFMLVCGVVIIVAEIACVLPVLIAIPIVLAGIWLAYVDHRAAIHAAAAEAGITLA